MFLHIGADVEVLKKDIVAIIDIETSMNGSTDFLENVKKAGIVNIISDDVPKTAILLENNKETKIFLSPISSSTLQKRNAFLHNSSSCQY